MPPKIARLAGLGAFGATAGLAGLFALIAWLAMPSARGGIDLTNAIVAWIAVGGLFLALILLHVYLGRQLLLVAQGEDVRHPL
ncbi:MAG: hypothetical protein JWO05_423 [Gemmatimonadetes bacterium]|nr:hypothetical protein [Gemmatimonadota bacterium]